VHAWIWDASNEDPTWAWAGQVDAVEGVAEFVLGAQRIAVRRWASIDAILIGVVLDPPEPVCTGGEHIWGGSTGGGYGRTQCRTCGLWRERVSVTCDGWCELDFDETEYVPGLVGA